MAKLDPEQNRYFPSQQKTGALHDDFRLLFNHVYDLREQLKGMTEQLATAHRTMSEMKAAHESAIAQLQEPANTKMLGLRVQPTDLADGQTLKYVAAIGAFKFM